jgi:hypothetical protein
MAAAQEQGMPVIVALRYASAADVRRDRLPDVPRGLLVRARFPVALGDRIPVTIELEAERVTIRASGAVRWVTPLVSVALTGLELEAASHRDGVQLDLAFGIRTAGPAPERHPVLPPPPMPASPTPAPATPARPLSVAMLQPNAVVRQALVNALGRLGREQGGFTVAVEATAVADDFLRSLAAEPRALAIIDCDGLGPAVDPLLTAIRSHEGWERLPLILLVSEGRSRFEDGHAVVLRKPFETKAFVDLASILVAASAS